jgi:ATP-binding cassette subfamily B protein
VVGLLLLTLVSNGLNLWVPKIIASGIDRYAAGRFDMGTVLLEFAIAAVCVLVLTYVQSVVQTVLSERVARDLRKNVSDKISQQSYAYIQSVNPSRLLTNLTADVDSIKVFVSQAVVSIASSLIIIVGASALLMSINWKLALAVLTMLPVIAGTFFTVFSRVRVLFLKGREVLDRLNKTINESILGSALIRVLNSEQQEYGKFLAVNTEAKSVGFEILKMFAGMIPVVTFAANLGLVILLGLGGHYVLLGTLTLGQFAAFNTYLSLLIFPIFILGFMSSLIAQASASYGRIKEVLDAPVPPSVGTVSATIRGDLSVQNVSLAYGEKSVMKEVSFEVKAGTKTAIIGPTAAGKTQLLYVLTGLVKPDAGMVAYDGRAMETYNPESLYRQVGFVFQDSIVFSMSVRENIAFSESVSEADVQKAIDTAELHDFIETLPQGLETVVSERGTSLSGGQKQRLMLARALALNPKVLLLDDFTARVDTETERRILANLEKNYPDLTLISVTQKVATVEAYDQILVLMEGELLASGTHAELLHSSPEYVQIVESQRSTSNL